MVDRRDLAWVVSEVRESCSSHRRTGTDRRRRSRADGSGEFDVIDAGREFLAIGLEPMEELTKRTLLRRVGIVLVEQHPRVAGYRIRRLPGRVDDREVRGADFRFRRCCCAYRRYRGCDRRAT